jgi:3-oxoacyl-[acyl-carrier-protein] synthase-1
LHDRSFSPMTMALVPDNELPPLLESVRGSALTVRQRRLLRLATSPLREALASGAPGVPLPLFLGLPEERSERVPPAQLIHHIAAQVGVTLDEKNSQAFPRGRAAALVALEAACAHLAKGRAEHAIVGGLDTYCDPALLDQLEREGRILGEQVMDGFVPGEGAAFLVLTARRSWRTSGGTKKVQVLGVGRAEDAGHRYSDKPAKGEGLWSAMERLLKGLASQPQPIATVYAGFNGESFAAKEWGVARLRHGDRFAQKERIEHPADCYGDVGAATGALLAALAGTALAKEIRTGPALVFASSDREDRACALLDLLP